MTEKTRIGIYGGTFSPPHFGHVHAAREFLRAAELDRLLIMPAGIPPHKSTEPGDDPYRRLQMCELAFSGMETVEVSDYEIRKPGLSYTSDTLEHFAAADAELCLLCGTDMFLTLDLWRRPETIFSLAHIFGMRREDTDISELEEKAEAYRTRFGARVSIISSLPTPASSTDIRSRLRAGESCEGILPGAVLDYIVQNRLYME